MNKPCILKFTLLLYWILITLVPYAFAGIWHVNNVSGSDDNAGTTPDQAFQTLARTVKALKPSDSISLINTGTPYREALVLTRVNGTPAKPIIIEGNGAVISGLRKIKSSQWTRKGDIYEIAGPFPYGWPSLLINGKQTKQGDPKNLQVGQWVWIRNPETKKKGTLIFYPEKGKTPSDYSLEATLEVSGIRFSSSSYIVIRNLISEFHSNDGFNIHGDCRSCVFENIEGRFNGDDGFSIHEAIEAVVRNGHFHHNGSGIEDVNLSRSFYSGIKVHDNRNLGVLFIGAFHSAVDAHVYDNPSNFRITPGTTKHLIGGEFSPIQGTSVYLQNIVTHGGNAGIFVTDRARVMITNSIIADCKTGIVAEKGSQVHLSKSVVANCENFELQCKGNTFFGDMNVYFPGRYQVNEQAFTPGQWGEFKELIGHHKEAIQQDPKLNDEWRINEPSLKRINKNVIGPTAFYEGLKAD